ncbi:DUF6285 domain-containing protein [Vineibacter terrae]|uniref:DUF6285 domain-containing protein n=1 Tax=Vineibacter terrae TaxID=2586908 RepID=UPI002E382028|nr:DUF6285 domain-containing protein [Vineibacter terrae]HEX2887247.1 DUF6285 domain-containing protein [Vineibacter terrae]
MAQDRPHAPELLRAIREFLASDVLPRLEGRTQFHLKVAINSLAILEREAASGADADARELQRLQALLGRDGTLAELNAQLAHDLRNGRRDETDAALMAHLRATIADKIAISNPKWR